LASRRRAPCRAGPGERLTDSRPALQVPRHWAKAEVSATGPRGKPYRLEIWGWSNESAAEALATARRRLAEVSARIARGVVDRSYAYGSRPLREEIIRSLGEPGGANEAIVTRNRYGALVLNTAQVPFIDVDCPEEPAAWWRFLQFLRPKPLATPGETLDRIRDACERRRRHAFRIYRTCAGFRVLVTDLLLDPRSAAAQDLLADFSADAAFRQLCKLQGSFRARLTPKPWRMDLPRPPDQHPREEHALRERFSAWLARYEAASERFATCRFLEAAGAGRPGTEARAIVDEHDRVTRATSELPLA
jgi:hypothetical protein